MCADNKASLEVDYRDLSNAQTQIAISLADAPSEMLEVRQHCSNTAVTQQY
jgi:hypothetical protein